MQTLLLPSPLEEDPAGSTQSCNRQKTVAMRNLSWPMTYSLNCKCTHVFDIGLSYARLRRYIHQDAFEGWDVPDSSQSFLDELAIKASQLTASCLYYTHWTLSDTLKSSVKCLGIRTTTSDETINASVLFTIFMLTYVSLNCKCAHLLEHWPFLC